MGPRDQGSRRNRKRAGRRAGVAVERLEGRQLPSALTFRFADTVGVAGTVAVDIEANAVADDASGNLFVAGSLQGTANFAQGGATQNLSSTAGARDVFVAEYSPSGALAWAKDLPGSGPGAVAQGTALAVDGPGNVYLTGTFTGTVNFDPNGGAARLSAPGRDDAFIAKFDHAGNLLWAKDVAGTAGAIDAGGAIAVDPSGNVYAGGTFQAAATFGAVTLTASGNSDAFVTKLDPSGKTLWARQTAGAGTSAAEAAGLAVDGAGNVVATGFFAGTINVNPGPGTTTLKSSGARDVFVAKLDGAGNLAWADDFGGTDIDQGNGVAVDSSGQVYVAGTFSGTVDFNPGPGITNLAAGGIEDAFVLKLSGAGQLVWARDLGGAAGSSAQGTGIGLDGAGDVYEAGAFSGTLAYDPRATALVAAGSFDAFVVEFDGAGNPLSALSAGGSNYDAATGIGVNASGTVAIAGRDSGPAAFGTSTLPKSGTRSLFLAETSATVTVATPPLAPSSPVLEVASDTGVSHSDNLTAASRPVFDVNQAGASNTVELDRDGLAVATRIGPGPIADPGPVADGVHSYTARQALPGGLSGPFSGALAVTIDTTPPARPAAPALLSGDDTGTVGDGITSVTQPHLIGTAEPGATVQLLGAGSVPLGSAALGAGGSYTIQVSAPLADATYTLTVQATDLAGNVSPPGALFTLTIVTVPPPTPPAPALLLADDTGVVGDGITAARQPHLVGTTLPGMTVQLVNGSGIVLGSAVSGADGRYSIATPAALADGVYPVRVQLVGVSGLVGATGPAFPLTIDATPPPAPGRPMLSVADDSGLLGDGVTNVNQPRLTGTAAPGATLLLVNPAGVVLGTAAVGSDGSYTVRPGVSLTDGTYTLYVQAVDVAGNVGAVSPPASLTIDTTPPASPGKLSLLAVDDSGTPGDGITNVTQPRLTGSAETGATIQLLNASGNLLASGTVPAGGAYSLRPNVGLTDGTYALYARAVDVAGNVGPSSPSFSLTILTLPPTAPSAPTLLAADDSGAAGDGITSVNPPRLTGTATPGLTIQILDPGGNVIGTAISGTGGSYTARPVSPFPDGTYSLTVRAVDRAGNLSPVGGSVALTVLTTAPPPPSAPILSPSDDTGVKGDGITAVRQPHLTGTAAPGQFVDLLDASGNVLGTTTALATGGGFSVQPTAPFGTGTQALRFRVRDAAGNVGAPGASVTLQVVETADDFDGDGRAEIGVFRPSTAQWIIQLSGGGYQFPYFGAGNLFDIPVPGDYDGVGHTELAVFRPSTGQWFVAGHAPVSFGAGNLFDIPVPGDYDGVGHTELAVFRPSTAQWFVAGHAPVSFGAGNLFDIPVPGDYDGVGHTELAVFRPSTGQWFVAGHAPVSFGAGNLFDIPVPGDYDGVGHDELAVFRPSTGQWLIAGHAPVSFGAWNLSDIPLEAPIGSLMRLGLVGSMKASAVTASVPSARSEGRGPGLVSRSSAVPESQAAAPTQSAPRLLGAPSAVVEAAADQLGAERLRRPRRVGRRSWRAVTAKFVSPNPQGHGPSGLQTRAE